MHIQLLFSSLFIDSIDVFGVKKWPITPGSNRRHLEECTQSCTLNPLPDFNQNGRLLVPNEYGTELEGSFVAMQVAFFHIFDATCNIGHMHPEIWRYAFGYGMSIDLPLQTLRLYRILRYIPGYGRYSFVSNTYRLIRSWSMSLGVPAKWGRNFEMVLYS